MFCSKQKRPVCDIRRSNIPVLAQYGCTLTPHAEFGSMLSYYRWCYI